MQAAARAFIRRDCCLLNVLSLDDISILTTEAGPMKTFVRAILIPGFLLFGCVTLEERLVVLEERMDNQQSKTEEGMARIESRLESMRETITKAEDEKDQTLMGRMAGFHENLNQIREEIRHLRGGFEEKEHALKQQLETAKETETQQGSRMNRVEEVTFENRDRLSRIEQYLNLEASKQTVSKPEPASKPEPPVEKEPTETDVYQSAKTSFDKGDFDSARQEFQSFLHKYPKSGNADNAQFWIGETHYREKWYEKAILEYQKVIENYPKGNKVQASLLKQGLAFFNLGDKANSRLILRELVSKYPKSNEAKIADQKLKEIN
ncbi:MAG TPA: tol-pal system protein YbgF [Deltaproteobacteria bacterium]|nr:tol-pal system protein YbgF [Deltaproteobacteria bacterium]